MGKKNRGNTSNKQKPKAGASTAPIKPDDSGPVAAHAQAHTDAPASTAGPSSSAPIAAKSKPGPSGAGVWVKKSASTKARTTDSQSVLDAEPGQAPLSIQSGRSSSAPADAPAAPHTPTATPQNPPDTTATTTSSSSRDPLEPSQDTEAAAATPTPTSTTSDTPIDTTTSSSGSKDTAAAGTPDPSDAVIAAAAIVIDATTSGKSQAEMEEALPPASSSSKGAEQGQMKPMSDSSSSTSRVAAGKAEPVTDTPAESATAAAGTSLGAAGDVTNAGDVTIDITAVGASDSSSTPTTSSSSTSQPPPIAASSSSSSSSEVKQAPSTATMPEAVRRELEAAAAAAAAGAAAVGDSPHPDAVDTMPSLSAGILAGPVAPDSSSSQHGQQQQQQGEEEGGEGDRDGGGDGDLPLVETQQPAIQPTTKQPAAAADLGVGPDLGAEAGTGEAPKPASPYIHPPSSSTAPGPNHPIMGAAPLTRWDAAEGAAVAALPAAATAATAATTATAATGSNDIINDIAAGSSNTKWMKPSAGPAAYHPGRTFSSSTSSSSSSSGGIKPFPPQLLPAVGTDPGLGPDQLGVLSVWYNKFCCETEAQLRAGLDQGCAEGMIFEDNFIKVSGRSLVGVQFSLLQRVLRGMDLEPEKIEVLRGPPGCATYVLRIISKIKFRLWDWRRYPMLPLVFPALLLLPETITSWATDELTVDAQDNRIVAYKQRVHNIPTAPTPVRWMLGMASSWLMMMVMQW